MMMMISYRFREKQRIKSKIANFSHPVYLTPTAKGVPLPIGMRRFNWVKKLE